MYSCLYGIVYGIIATHDSYIVQQLLDPCTPVFNASNFKPSWYCMVCVCVWLYEHVPVCQHAYILYLCTDFHGM